jgi:Trk K+ transport system NAD-binding subunit
MKSIATHLSFYLKDKEVTRNIGALLKYLLFLSLVVVAFAVAFHFIMLYEGQEHSWITGLYWTLTVMSTLGFGDITFTSDLGRLFSIFVLMTGIIMLLVVLPFAFISYLYAPWLEARLKTRAPRRVPSDVTGHIIICSYETIAEDLVKRLMKEDLPFFVVEPDFAKAADLYNLDIPVIRGEPEDIEVHAALRLEHAHMLIANREDTANTNIILTAREHAPDVEIIAIANNDESTDILSLSGATHVLPLKRWLGEQLANRVRASHAETQVIGHYRDLGIAELPVRHTPLAGKTIRESRLREVTGATIIAVWEHGHIYPSRPETKLTDASVAVVAGSAEQLEALDDLLMIYDFNANPVIVIGGGRVGRAAARALKAKDTPVHVIEKRDELLRKIEGVCDVVFHGDAADYEFLMKAGLKEAPSVVLTTHDDGMNIYLASYCRRLSPDVRIVSRITHERNIDAIHRAGADFVLSYATLSVNTIMSILKGKELVLLGEGVDLYTVPLPASLIGRTLAGSGIGARTGLHVIAIQQNGQTVTNPPATTVLTPSAELVVLGSTDQREQFKALFHQ